ncbi:MAG: glycosyltransferase [Candidatus Omnitrophica bacterium]|nr:glycosyltransferase [Candidatus Omnitrophota bacterium]
MKIGVDVREFRKGVFTGIRNLLKDFLFNADTMSHGFVLFADSQTDLEALPENMEKVVLECRSVFLWDQVVLPRALERQGVDVFFSPYPKTPLRRVCPFVNMICDVIPLAVPKYSGLKGVLEKAHFILVSGICGRRSSATITISEDARMRITRIFGLPLSRVGVVHPSVQRGSACQQRAYGKYGLKKGKYILYLGNFKPHKNLERLLKAYYLLPSGLRSEYALLLAGGEGKDFDRIKKRTGEFGREGNVVIAGTVDEQDRCSLVKDAGVFVFPSLCEGFGLPPLEALAEGVPAAVSNLSPMTEVLGPGAVYFDPYDPVDISKKLVSLLTNGDLRSSCARAGMKRAQRYSPKTTARDLTNLLVDTGLGKILCVSSEFPPLKGGISTMVYNLWTRLPSRRVIILTARPGEEKENTVLFSPELVREPYPLGGDTLSRIRRTFFLVCEIYRLSLKRNVRMVHAAQVMSAGIAALMLKMLKGFPYVVYVYSADMLEFGGNPFLRPLLSRVLGKADSIISCSEFAKDLVVNKYPGYRGKITVLTPGVDTSRFGPEWSAPGIRSRYGIPVENKVVLSVSRLSLRKGHDTVIEALSLIKDELEKVTYTVIGEGEQRQNLEKLAREKGLADKIVFAGPVPEEELVYFYTDCDIFILLPRYVRETGSVEGFGAVFLEANACGKPVIAASSGGVPEAVIDGETGILVEPEDASGAAEALKRLLGDRDLARKMGMAGRERVLRDFDWSARAEKLWDMVREVERRKKR